MAGNTNTNTDYTHSFQIPASKDWVFRGRKSQGELKDNHPDVTRIHVADRSTATPTTAGFDVVKLTIRGKDKQTVMDCYQEGRTKILASLAYDAEKADKKKVDKARRADRRHHQKARELEAKHAPKDQQDVGGGSVLLQKAMAAIKAHEVKDERGEQERELEALAGARNGFAGLDIEEVQTEEAKAQAAANLRKQRRMMPAPVVVAASKPPALSGWAKMASKAPVEVVAKKPASVVGVMAPKKKVAKVVSNWTPLPEDAVGGWDANW